MLLNFRCVALLCFHNIYELLKPQRHGDTLKHNVVIRCHVQPLWFLQQKTLHSGKVSTFIAKHKRVHTFPIEAVYYVLCSSLPALHCEYILAAVNRQKDFPQTLPQSY